MLQPVMLRLTNEQLILGEIEQLPNPTDQFMIIRHPRQRDGLKLVNLQDDVATILIPWHQIALVQLLPGSGIEEIIGFVRE